MTPTSPSSSLSQSTHSQNASDDEDEDDSPLNNDQKDSASHNDQSETLRTSTVDNHQQSESQSHNQNSQNGPQTENQHQIPILGHTNEQHDEKEALSARHTENTSQQKEGELLTGGEMQTVDESTPQTEAASQHSTPPNDPRAKSDSQLQSHDANPADIQAYYEEQQRVYEQEAQQEHHASSHITPNTHILSHELIQRFTSSPLHHITILDLSSLGLISHSLQPLKTYALETLLLSHNKIRQLNCLSSLNNLWKLDLRYNALTSLDFLYLERSCWKVLGSLLLGWNKLHDVAELFSFLAVTQVIELQLQGNTFEMCHFGSASSSHSKLRPSATSFTLTHEELTNLVYTICPHVWILDGIFITEQDRDVATQFFNTLQSLIAQKELPKHECRRINQLLALREELALLFNKERRRRSKRSYLPLGRRAREFISLNLIAESTSNHDSTTPPDDDYTKLRFLAVFQVENYLLERSLVVPEEIIYDKSLPNGMESLNDSIHIRVSPTPSPQNIMRLGPPFHTSLLYELSKEDANRVQMILRSSLLFRINFRVECELYHAVLRRGSPRYDQLTDTVKNVVLQELAQLAPYSRLCLIQMLNDKMLLLPHRFVSTQFSVEDKYQMAHYLYRRVLNTSCYKDAQVIMEMSDLFDFIANIDEPSNRSLSTPQLRSDSITDRQQSRMSIDSARIIPDQRRALDRKRHVHIDRTPKYVLDNPEHSSSFYYSSVRVPRESELVLLHGQWTAVLEILRNGVVVLNIRNDRHEYLAVSKENMIWVPSGSRGGYWKVQDASRKPIAEQKLPKKSDLKLFTANDTWQSTFLVASKECVAKLNEKEGGRWSSITDRIPFKIFQVPDEFVIQPGQINDEPPPMPQGSPPRRTPETRSSTFLTEVFSSRQDPEDDYNQREEIPEEMDSASASTSLDSRSTSRRSRRPASRQAPRVTQTGTSSPGTTSRSRGYHGSPRSGFHHTMPPPSTGNHSFSQTHGGMPVNVPNMLHDLSARNHQLQTTPHLRSQMQWNTIPGKSMFVVHNPLQMHPFTQKPAKKHRPIVTEPLVRYVKHDNLDASPPAPIVPERPFRTRYAQYQRQVWNYHRNKKQPRVLQTVGSKSPISRRSSATERERYQMYGKGGDPQSPSHNEFDSPHVHGDDPSNTEWSTSRSAASTNAGSAVSRATNSSADLPPKPELHPEDSEIFA